MPHAIQQIVDANVRLKNRQTLEDLRMHRQRLAADLNEEIAVIEAGLERLNP
jgi:hypothetical protein